MDLYFAWINKIAVSSSEADIYLAWWRIWVAFREAFAPWPGIIASVAEEPTVRRRLFAVQMHWAAAVGLVAFVIDGVDYLTLARRMWATGVILENRAEVIEGFGALCCQRAGRKQREAEGCKEATEADSLPDPVDLMDAVTMGLNEWQRRHAASPCGRGL